MPQRLGIWMARLALLAHAGCAAHEQGPLARAEESLEDARPAAPTPPAESAASAPPTAHTQVQPRTRIEHALRPFHGARGDGSFHRFRVPLEGASISFVELGYETPLVDALGEHDLVINGGYWAYYGGERRIQGLLVVNGRPLAPRAGTRSGGVLQIEAGRARLLAPAQPVVSSATLAVQCSPRLVDRGRIIPKLDANRRAARTALCIREHGRTLDIYLTADDTRTSLAELGSLLVAEGCEAALNLDGGPSTAAVFRAGPLAVVKVGVGAALPYGLGFVLRK